MSNPMNSSLGVEQSGKAGGDAHGTGMSGSSAFGGGMGGGGYGFGSGQGGDATSSSTATGALGGDVSDNTSIGSITINS
jgi:hypothetical protein